MSFLFFIAVRVQMWLAGIAAYLSAWLLVLRERRGRKGQWAQCRDSGFGMVGIGQDPVRRGFLFLSEYPVERAGYRSRHNS